MPQALASQMQIRLCTGTSSPMAPFQYAGRKILPPTCGWMHQNELSHSPRTQSLWIEPRRLPQPQFDSRCRQRMQVVLPSHVFATPPTAGAGHDLRTCGLSDRDVHSDTGMDHEDHSSSASHFILQDHKHRRLRFCNLLVGDRKIVVVLHLSCRTITCFN